ncbi:MAG: glycerophosphodiester phosphodiesterase family protein, partial [Bacteroidetes bacterium]|nr:glycerophosphodiester phosphodiesterase family protein [Bacteroidota bacterium]
MFIIFNFSGLAQEQKKIEIHGHRGFRGKYPENTLTAFKEAAKAGVDYIELDVIISKDSQVVVSHEPWFNATTCSYPNQKAVKKIK